MPEEVTCNLCGENDTHPLFRLRDYRLQVDDVEWTAVSCRRCGLGYLNPRPTTDEIVRYYPPAYFCQRKHQLDRYRRQAAYVKQEPGRLLDIGTANGDFLEVMAERGWDVEGIEQFDVDDSPRAFPIHRQRFPDDCTLPNASFDVVTAWAVLEHLYDPASAFQQCERLLKPGGVLIAQIPNLRSIYSRWAMQEDVPRHLYFFTERTLRSYGNRVGLELTQVWHTTDLFGGSGRGVARLGAARALGRSTSEFFEIWRTPRRERFRRWPLFSIVWTAASALESVVLADSVVRRARISGQIVVRFDKPRALAFGARETREAA
jgi:SAM-dependent methyltransferase